MTTELDALASGSAAIASAAVDNDLGDLYCALELAVDFVSAPGEGEAIDLFFVRLVDGTNYEDAVTGASEVPRR